jgi:ABC-type glutathione transport system ATPase component
VTAGLIRVEGLTKSFETGALPWRRVRVTALAGVDFEVMEGETLAVVGESGSGKSTVCRVLLGLTRPSSGLVTYKGRDLIRMRRSERKSVRREIQGVFQDPSSSFNPRRSLRAALAAPLEVHSVGNDHERNRLVELATERVGIDVSLLDRLPHQVSGGQRQRLAIARALVLRPSIVLLDEPVSSLDVSVQAQVLNLLRTLQSELGLTYVFVSHNLAVVRYLADRVAVMREGRIVEIGEAAQVFGNPRDGYTRLLLAAVPSLTSASHRDTKGHSQGEPPQGPPAEMSTSPDVPPMLYMNPPDAIPAESGK